MLVLTRRPGESIIIGKDLVKIKVLSSNGQNVRLGIEAPKELSVHREEIYHCIANDTYQQRTNKPEVKKSEPRTIEQPDSMESREEALTEIDETIGNR